MGTQSKHDRVVTDAERLRRLYREYAEGAMAALGSPVYAAICFGLSSDPARGDLALAAAPGFRIPNILLAAVHHLLLSGAGDPLASYYPTVVGDGRARPVDDGLYPAFASFVDRHLAALRELIGNGTTQTNEVGRSALTLPALSLVARPNAPLALLEIGSSGGLNLLLDRFRYRVGEVEIGDPSASVEIVCGTVGALLPPIPPSLPQIDWRAGLDRSPLDVTQERAAAWLRAQVFPEHRDRMARLEAAIALARAERPPVARGDAASDLARLAAMAPPEPRLVIVSTSVLVYLDASQRGILVENLRGVAAARREGAWLVACEPETVLESLGLGIGRSGLDAPELNGLALCHLPADGDGGGRLLAMCHPHGRWIRWLDPVSAGSPA